MKFDPIDYKLNVRAATMQDTNQLLRWKNDYRTRKYAIVTKSRIPKKAHQLWLEDTLRDWKHVLLCVLSYEGQDCGDLRFDISPKEVEVGIRIDRKFRNKGIGSAAIRMASRIASGKYKQPLIAKIVVGNEASLRVFTKNHYEIIGYTESPEVAFWTLKYASNTLGLS